MSSDAAPISPARFAEALKDLPLSTLHLKAAELRNSIAHLDYSNEQLKPFAEGTDPAANGQPDQDCIDAIKENEIVISRMQNRIALLKAEVEGRGCSWTEFQSSEELPDGVENSLPNGTDTGDASTDGEVERSNAWNDGTFTTGRTANGEIRMGNGPQTSVNGTSSTGGTLDDDALRRAMDERMRALAEEDEGIHL